MANSKETIECRLVGIRSELRQLVDYLNRCEQFSVASSAQLALEQVAFVSDGLSDIGESDTLISVFGD